MHTLLAALLWLVPWTADAARFAYADEVRFLYAGSFAGCDAIDCALGRTDRIERPDPFAAWSPDVELHDVRLAQVSALDASLLHMTGTASTALPECVRELGCPFSDGSSNLYAAFTVDEDVAFSMAVEIEGDGRFSLRRDSPYEDPIAQFFRESGRATGLLEAGRLYLVDGSAFASSASGESHASRVSLRFEFVPEPGTLSLVALGLAIRAAARRDAARARCAARSAASGREPADGPWVHR